MADRPRLPTRALDLITRQVGRLWYQSESCRATYPWLRAAEQRLISEEQATIGALEGADLGELLHVADAHRAAAEVSVLGFLRAAEGGEDDD